MLTEAKATALELGDLTTDQRWLQAQIARLKKKSIVALEHIGDLHQW